MKKVIEKCKQIYNKETPLKVEWLMFGIIAFIMLISFYYIDFRSLTIWTTNIWDCVADGDIRQYYVYTGFNIYNVPHQFVSGTLYSLIIWGIWNLPIWGIQRFMGKAIVNNAFLLLWSKLFLVVALGITLFFTYKICKELFKDNKKSLWITYLAATFIFTYIGVFYAGQNDILICMLAVLGLYFLIKEKNIWFYIFSALAISVKYFYLIAYIPIILLTEKKIWKIIAKTGLGVAPIFIFKLLVGNFPMYSISEQSNHSTQLFSGLLGGGIIGANKATISFFVVGLIIVYFMAYIIKPKTKELKKNYIFYFSVVPFMLMFMFSTYYEFYRPILLMPMLMILYGFKPELFRINIILDTILSIVSLIVFPMCDSHMFMSRYSMNTTIITKLLKIKQVNSIMIYDVYKNIFKDNIQLIKNLGLTIVFAVLAIMIIINHPKINVKKEERQKPEKIERWIIWLRTLIVVPVLMFLFLNIK